MRKGLALLALLGTLPASARVIPLGQVSPVYATPGLQKPTARHMVAVEVNDDRTTTLVIHDAQGFEPPRRVANGVSWCAAWEGENGAMRLLSGGWGVRYSADGGATWTTTTLNLQLSGTDALGALRQHVGLGTADVPFVVAESGANGSVWAVKADGSTALLARGTNDDGSRVLGSDSAGTRFLVAIGQRYQPVLWKLYALGLDGKLDFIFGSYSLPDLEGWFTPSGAAYLAVDWPSGSYPEKPLSSRGSLALWKDGVLAEVVSRSVIACPTADGAGAWVALDESPSGVSLKRHTPEAGLVELWRDPASPPVVSLHAGASGRTLLVRTSRARHDQWGWEAFGVAIWEVGSPAPPARDELIAGGSSPHRFIHLDVDAAAQGAPFVVDTGPNYVGGCPGWCPELPKPLGIVRASLKQRLVIPASARLPGAAGATWRTDLLIRNPEARPVALTARLLPNPDTATRPPDATLTIAGGATALLPDVLSTLFGLERGSGAILLLPEGTRGIRATSRTYTRSEHGTYGMSADGVDAVSAARTDFPLTFSAALLGAGFRTNVLAADVSSVGSVLRVAVPGIATPLGAEIPADAQAQLSGLAKLLGTGDAPKPVMATPASGAVVAGLTAIDGRTNDASWFAPDRRAEEMLRIPVLVHADGAAGAKFRTDLYIFNPEPAQQQFAIDRWITLEPGESRVIPDALFTLFGRSGAEPLWVMSTGVRLTTRTYTVEPDGSTYGTVIPPLDPLHMADAGETLEILGPTGGPDLRTNLALVGKSPASVEVLDETGALVDAFDKPATDAEIWQVNDLFRSRGLGSGPKAAAIRVTFASGWGNAAYATTIDNGTNDPVYFAGALGSH